MTSFSTTFATVENPISDGGQLITSTSPGVDWSGLALGGSGTLPVAPVDVVAPGEAESVDYANPNYGDALAVATGAWAPDQSASVVVGNIPAQSGGYEEIEVHLRTDPTTGAGYEITWGYNNDYIAVATWNATAVTPTCPLRRAHNTTSCRVTRSPLRSRVTSSPYSPMVRRWRKSPTTITRSRLAIPGSGSIRAALLPTLSAVSRLPT